MERIVFNLVRNLLIVKNNFEKSDDITVSKTVSRMNCNNEMKEETVKFYCLNDHKIVMVNSLQDITFSISGDEYREKKPSNVAKRIYKEIQKHI